MVYTTCFCSYGLHHCGLKGTKSRLACLKWNAIQHLFNINTRLFSVKLLCKMVVGIIHCAWYADTQNRNYLTAKISCVLISETMVEMLFL
jgi:hypothetical protein